LFGPKGFARSDVPLENANLRPAGCNGKPLLALPQRLLSQLAFGNITTNGLRFDKSAFGIEETAIDKLHPPHLSKARIDAVLNDHDGIGR
jgi:hypothetical protein